MMFDNVALCVVLVCTMVPSLDAVSVEENSDSIVELRAEIDMMKGQLLNTTHELQELKERSEHQDEQYDINPLAVREIGFTVRLSTPLHNLPIGHTLIYGDVFSNIGSAYSTTTGIFTCPESGLYLFAIFVHALNIKTAAISIVVEGSHKTSAVSEPLEQGEDDTGGNMYVGHLAAGQRVWVVTYDHNDQDLYDGFTTFSGVLIQSST